jgi:hypothetical protein
LYAEGKTWMAGSSPALTKKCFQSTPALLRIDLIQCERQGIP